MKRLFLNAFMVAAAAGSMLLTSCSTDDNTVNFTTVNFNSSLLTVDTFWNGSDLKGKMVEETAFNQKQKVYYSSITNNIVTFKNRYNQTSTYWGGVAISTKTNDTQDGFTNQYSTYVGSAHRGGAFLVFYGSDTIQLTKAVTIKSIDLANTTYAALAIKNGDQFTAKFGGKEGGKADWFKLAVTGLNASGATLGADTLYLADYRNADNTKDYILKEWKTLDISKFGKVSKLVFKLSSSDSGEWGMNTPAYFCLDNIKYSVE